MTKPANGFHTFSAHGPFITYPKVLHTFTGHEPNTKPVT